MTTAISAAPAPCRVSSDQVPPTSRSLALPLPLLPGLVLAPCLPRPGHAGRKVVAGAVFAFLLLKDRIIHVDVVKHGRQVLVAQQLL